MNYSYPPPQKNTHQKRIEKPSHRGRSLLILDTRHTCYGSSKNRGRALSGAVNTAAATLTRASKPHHTAGQVKGAGRLYGDAGSIFFAPQTNAVLPLVERDFNCDEKCLS
ncbi:hypothetical protein BaRGS_00023737 [Batillaria attramentaria]|uniref:Uncharacterized protein n=1 Tax=Batillaria attramentaria TaxID=370345 RepID=A0ABD0KCU9_9CAEN